MPRTHNADTRAITPGIGMIFIIAFTVSVAALTGAIAADAIGDIATGEPNTNIEYTHDTETGELHIEHAGGETIQPGAHLTITSTNPDTDRELNADLYTQGDTVVLQDVEPGDEIRIEWKYYHDTATIDTHTIE